jgi:hypothetical protein
LDQKTRAADIFEYLQVFEEDRKDGVYVRRKRTGRGIYMAYSSEGVELRDTAVRT